MKVKEEGVANPIKYKWFEMTLNVLRDGNEMMKLVRYNVLDSASSASGNDIGSLAAGTTTGD